MKYLLLAVLLLPGLAYAEQCPPVPTDEQRAAADYGPEPTDVEEKAREYLEFKLRDMGTAKIVFFKKPVKLWKVDVCPYEYVWSQQVKINAKNAYGAYAGYKDFLIYFRDNKVVGHYAF